MSELPPGWSNTTVGEMLRFNYGKGLPERSRSGEGFPVFGSNGIVGRHREALVQCESLVIGRKGSVGVVHHSREPSWPIDTTYYIDNFVGMPPRFWFYALRHLRLDSLDRATAIPGLNREDAYLVELAVPPLDEQRRIADKLDAVLARVDACRERLDRIPAILKRFRKSVLTAATTGELTANRTGRATGHPWKTERADDVCEKVQSGGTPKEGFEDEPGIPFLKVYNIVNQKVDFEYRPQFVTPAVHNGPLAKSRTLPGDVLMNIVGPPLGKVAVVPATFKEWNINQAITLFRPSSRISSEWLYIVLCSGQNVNAIVHETRGSAGQSNISLSQCRDFVFPVPSMEEQREAAKLVGALFAFADRLEAHLKSASQSVEKLTPATLAKAFRGELVPQDPNDEPASVLLERIRAARKEQPMAQRKPRAMKPRASRLEPVEAAKAAIRALKVGTYSFDELRGLVSADYESLKDAVFQLLDEPHPPLKQQFDEKKREMRLQRVAS